MGYFEDAGIGLESGEKVIKRGNFKDTKLFWKKSSLGGDHYRGYKGELVLTDKRLIAVNKVMGKSPALSFVINLDEFNQVGVDEAWIGSDKLMLSSEYFRGSNKERKIRVDEPSEWKEKIQQAQSEYSEERFVEEREEDPLKLLKMRFAKGEITEEEFTKKKKLLE